MSLSQDLANLAAQMADQLPQEVQTQMAAAAAELANSGLTDNSLTQGDRIPEFTLPNATGGQVTISELLASGPVVISFYRGGWCPYCNLELRALQQALPDIQARGLPWSPFRPKPLIIPSPRRKSMTSPLRCSVMWAIGWRGSLG